MFCPKCGAQNSDGTRFCRGCGADVSSVPTALTAKQHHPASSETRPPFLKQEGSQNLAEKQIDLYGSGMRGVLIGVGFLITSAITFSISIQIAVLAMLFLAFASYFLGTGIARLMQSRALKLLVEPSEAAPALPPYQNEYIKPAGSIYETDDLAHLPSSITEHTTTHLKMDPEKR